jgi:hypothetical protein
MNTMFNGLFAYSVMRISIAFLILFGLFSCRQEEGSSRHSGRKKELDKIHFDQHITQWKGSDREVLGYYMNLPYRYLEGKYGGRLFAPAKDKDEFRKKLISFHDPSSRALSIMIHQTIGKEDYLERVSMGLFTDAQSHDTLFVMCYDQGSKFFFLDHSKGEWHEKKDHGFVLFNEEQRQMLTDRPVGSNGGVPQANYSLDPDKGLISVSFSVVTCDEEADTRHDTEFEFKKGRFYGPDVPAYCFEISQGSQKGKFRVDCSYKRSYSLEVIGVNGYQFSLIGNEEIDLSGLPKGEYIVRLSAMNFSCDRMITIK